MTTPNYYPPVDITPNDPDTAVPVATIPADRPLPEAGDQKAVDIIWLGSFVIAFGLLVRAIARPRRRTS